MAFSVLLLEFRREMEAYRPFLGRRLSLLHQAQEWHKSLVGGMLALPTTDLCPVLVRMKQVLLAAESFP